MPRTRNPYSAQFTEQLIALAQAGRSVEALAREFQPCAATIHGWIKQAGRDDDHRTDGERTSRHSGLFAVLGRASCRREVL